MLSHWDSAGQRDVRSTLLEEIPAFLDEVAQLRADKRTAQMRLVMDFGPVAPKSSTGWRNDFALAAAQAHVKRETNVRRPELGVEWLEPSYFQVTLPRREEHAEQDGLHFHKYRENSVNQRVDPRTGDRRFCTGAIGEAYSRLLLDYLCPRTEAAMK
jgi:hypothetical protein